MSKTAGTDLKRLPVKLVRDRAKSAYKKDSDCYICGTEEKLEFHHYYSVDMLFTKWCKENNIKITCTDDVLNCRDDFISDNHEAIYDLTVTLCKKHHTLLHRVYGQKPLLSTGPKQMRWTKRQRDKHYK